MDEHKLNKQELNKLSPRDLFHKYVKFAPLYIICLVLAFLAAWLYLRYAQEVYSTTGSILINTGNAAGGGNSNDKVEEILESKNKGVSLQNEMEVLHSKPLVARVVHRMGGEFEYIVKGKIKDMNAYKQSPFTIVPVSLTDSTISFSAAIHFINANQFTVDGGSTSYGFEQDFKTAKGTFRLVKNDIPVPGSNYIVSYAPADVRAAQIIRSLNVQPKLANTGIVLINYEATNPFFAADFVNTLISEYATYSLEISNASRDSTLSFIVKSMRAMDRDIDSLKNKIVAFQKANQVIDPDAQIKDQLTKSGIQDELLNQQRLTVSVLDQVEGYLANKTAGRSLAPSAYGINDAGLNNILQQYNTLKIERDALVQSNVPVDNPQVTDLDRKLEIVRRSALENVKAFRANTVKTIGFASAQKENYKGDAFGKADKTFELVDLQSQLQFKREAYNNFLQKQGEAMLSKYSNVATSQIIEKAEPNGAPVAPKNGTIKLAALIIGLLLPTAFIFIKEVLNDKISIRNDIERVTDAPIIGEIGHSSFDKTLVVNQTNRNLIAEQFRIIRSNLQYIIGKHDKAVLMVTSSYGGEGKSFISTNIGAVLALTDKKTIILEFDLRKPRVLAGLDMNKRSGISNYMVGNVSLDSLIVPIADTENLYVLPCGPIPPNPAELLLSNKIEELFKQLRAKFDYIIIDTAPVGMVGDALTLGKFADCTLYVARQSYTYKRQIGLIDEMYRTGKMPHVSIVMNDVKAPTGGGYYGNYGYGYGYGESRNDGYYDDTTPKRTVLERIGALVNPLNWFGRK